MSEARQSERLGRICYIKARIGWRGLSSSEYMEEGPFLIAGQHIKSGQIAWDKCDHISEQRYQESHEIILRSGDVILTKDGTIGRVARVDELPGDATINGTMMLVRPLRRLDYRYLYHVLNGRGFQKLIEDKVSGSSIPHIFQRDMVELEVDLPPIDQQSKIAEILDTLDEAIRRTDAVVGKLKAVKQGLLHDLLTRGIDANGNLRPPQPDAPHLYKETPLGWLPKEWSFSNLGAITSLITSGSRGWAQYYADEGQLFVRSQNVRMGRLDLTERQHVRVAASAEGARTGLEASDFLVTITGNGVGNACVVPSDWEETGFVSQHVGLVRFYEKSLGEYAGRYFIAGGPGNHQIVDAQYGQSKPGLSLTNLRDLKMGIPPESEKSKLMEILSETDERISAEAALLDKLRLQKSGLMEDLLTGQVSVTPLL